MCGIAGIVNYGNKPLSLSYVEYIFNNLEQRGDDASGIYYERVGEQDNCSRGFKGPFTATSLWDNLQGRSDTLGIPMEYKKKWQLTGSERMIMMHTRAATKGTVANNHNNMPIFGHKWVLVHNGMVHGPRLADYSYKGEVDSEDLLAHLEVLNSPEKAIGAMTGSMAIIARPLLEDCLYLYRNSNPLSIVISEERRIVFICSKPEYVLDEEMIELLDDEDDIFKKGQLTVDLTPNVLYRLSLLEPHIEALSVYNPITSEWKPLERTECWDYSESWQRNLDGLED